MHCRGQSRICWLGFELLSAFAIETTSFRGVCRSSCRLPSLPLKPSPSSELFVTVVYSIPHRRTLDTQGSSLIVQQLSVIDLHYWELLHFKVHFGVPPRRLLRFLILFQFRLIGLDALQHSIHSFSFKRSVREVAKLYGCEKSLPVVEAHHPLSGLHFIAISALESSVLQVAFCDSEAVLE
ncbi:hypothetical protein Scep_019559 [Stephania cephalantha]|uniref:Uncharacterized protein n=1 Tax=Stephania cephalantha TaxID=152367 RepID=A0AAP0IB47_9MAGN